MGKIRDDAIKGSIAHWEKMIAWVETQNPGGLPFSIGMKDEIGESWRDACPLCTTYVCHMPICPLSIANHTCGEEFSPWDKVNNSYTWAEWIINAKNMLKVLNNLDTDPPMG